MSLLTSLRRNYEQGRISGTLLLGLGILLAIVLFSIIGPMFVDAVNAQVGAATCGPSSSTPPPTR